MGSAKDGPPLCCGRAAIDFSSQFLSRDFGPVGHVTCSKRGSTVIYSGDTISELNWNPEFIDVGHANSTQK